MYNSISFRTSLISFAFFCVAAFHSLSSGVACIINSKTKHNTTESNTNKIFSRIFFLYFLLSVLFSFFLRSGDDFPPPPYSILKDFISFIHLSFLGWWYFFFFLIPFSFPPNLSNSTPFVRGGVNT